MNPDLLSQLAADHAPPPAPWFPPAPGWWLVALAVVLVTVAIVLWWRRPAARLRRATLREIARLDRAKTNDHDFAQSLEDLLRRFAIARHGRDAVSPLCGDAWLSFLSANGGDAFAGDPGHAMLRAAYGGGAKPARAAWLSGARGFVQGRRSANAKSKTHR